MFRRFSADFAIFSIFFDAILVDLALFIAALARPALNALDFIQPLPPIEIPGTLYVIFPLLWVGVLMLFSAYDGRRNLRVTDEMGTVTLAALLAPSSQAGVLYFSYRDVSRALFLVFCGLAFLLQVAWRLVYRVAYNRRLLPGMNERRVLILGAGVVGRHLAEQFKPGNMYGLTLAGFLDDSQEKQRVNKAVLGSLDDARRVIAEQRIEDVVVALPLSAHLRLNQVVSELHDQPVRVWVIPDYFSLTLHRASVEDFAGIPMLDLRGPALSEYQRMTKRAFDLAVTLLLAVPAGLLMGLIALAVVIDSGRPVFYRQKRVGENGRLFDMVKFRTMAPNADRLAGQVERRDANGNLIHKRRDDPRVTRVGRFLRRTSLDELPQLINVARGEMSLVGPRPEMPFLVEKYEPWQRKRFAVPQGMTGWWQVNGRSDRPMHLNTEDDLYYVQHYSIWLDLQILLKTVWVVLRGKGAY